MQAIDVCVCAHTHTNTHTHTHTHIYIYIYIYNMRADVTGRLTQPEPQPNVTDVLRYTEEDNAFLSSETDNTNTGSFCHD